MRIYMNLCSYVRFYAAAAESLQSCPTLCDIDGSPPGSPVPGILQATTVEWVAFSSPDSMQTSKLPLGWECFMCLCESTQIFVCSCECVFV